MKKNGLKRVWDSELIGNNDSFGTFMTAVLALEDKFEYLYDVELESGQYTLFVNKQTIYENIELRHVEYEDFFADSAKNSEEVVYPEDREIVSKILNKDYIKKHLKKGKNLEYESRIVVGGRPIWFRTRIAYRDSQKHNIIVGVFNCDEEIRVREREERLRSEMINKMLGGESLYLIDPYTDGFQVIHRNRYLTETYGKNEKYSQSIAKYIKSDVYEPDRERMLKVTEISSVMARLRDTNEFEELYKDVSSGEPYQYKMQVVKFSETEILMGFSNIDKEYLDKAIHKKVEEEFFAMFAVDLELSKVRVLKKSLDIVKEKVGDTLTYAELIEKLIGRYEGETKAFFEKLGDTHHVQKQLAHEDRVSYTYKSGKKWITVDGILLQRNEEGVATAYALGFRYSDYLVVEKEELQTKLNASREKLQLAYEKANEEARRKEIEATNARLRADALSYITDNEKDPKQFLDYFAERILEVFNCDQVLFRDMSGNRIVHNAPGVEDVPVEVCQKCAFSKFDGEAYVEEGIAVLDDCSKGYRGFFTHPDCRVKSSVMQQVYTEGKLTGLISLHYLKELHSFSDTEIEMLKTIASYLGIMIGRIEAKHKIAEENVFTNFFLNSYVSAYYINLKEFTWHSYKRSEGLQKSYPIDESYLESIGRYINTEIHPDDREKVSILIKPEEIKRKIRNRNNFNLVYRKISEEKERVIRCDVVRGEDDDHVAFGFIDITDSVLKQEEDEKKLREALLAAQSASDAKTAFLNNMSHDIRTPMNAIMGFANMAKRHTGEADKITDCLEKIQESGNVLLSLINSVLEVSRIESGQAILEKQYGDVYYSFTNIESTMRELADSKDVKLEFTIGRIVNRYVFVDMARCMRIFVNVISNAIKYTQAGGEVHVKCEQIGEEENGIGRFCYTITDNGIGMSEDFQQHVFEQFARERNATISGIQGTGLGMAVCKSYVGLMGGTIECQSKQGVGTTFTIVLPFELQNERKYTDPFTGEVITVAEHSEVYKKVEFDREMILLVEDNDLNREIAVEILEEEGLMVEEAVNGLDAVNKVKANGPYYYKLILMDIQMPVMNGYEATKAIRGLFPEEHIPIVALSANAFVEDKMESKKVGMDGHVAKPIVIQELLGILKKFLKTDL